jgi:hypothetical protein
VSFLAVSVLGCGFIGGGVDGRVLDAATGQPVAGAQVVVQGVTATATTDQNGSFHIRGLAAGPQKLTATKASYVSLEPVSLTVGQVGSVHASDLLVFPLPPASGAYVGTPSGLSPLTRTEEPAFQPSGVGRKLYLADSAMPTLTAFQSPVDIVVDSGESAPELVGLEVFPLLHRTPVNVGFMGDAGAFPARWVISGQPAALKSTILAPHLTRLQGALPEGRFVLRRRHPSGIADWYFLFEVKGGQAGPPLGTLSSIQLDDALTAVFADVDSLRTAALGYDAAFDGCVDTGPQPRSPDALDEKPVPWSPGTAFDTLGWSPGHATPAVFEVRDCSIVALLDADGDGTPAVIIASLHKAPERVTPTDVY